VEKPAPANRKRNDECHTGADAHETP